MNKEKSNAIAGIIELLILVGLHWMLTKWFAGNFFIASFFVVGSGIPAFYKLLVVVFLVIRVLVLCLPGIILGRAGAWIYDFVARKLFA